MSGGLCSTQQGGWRDLWLRHRRSDSFGSRSGNAKAARSWSRTASRCAHERPCRCAREKARVNQCTQQIFAVGPTQLPHALSLSDGEAEPGHLQIFIANPTREVLNALMRRESIFVDDVLMPYYQDVYDHVLRAADWTDSLRDLVSTILETNLTIQGNRMNEIMKAVTSWAAIAAVPTIITGYYGMNVRIFPAANSLLGGVIALVLMVVGVAALYVTFKRRGWL